MHVLLIADCSQQDPSAHDTWDSKYLAGLSTNTKTNHCDLVDELSTRSMSMIHRLGLAVASVART